MKKVLAFVMGLMAAGTTLNAAVYNVTKWSEYSAAWGAVGLEEGAKDTILFSATDATGRDLASDNGTKAGCVYIIGVNDENGNRPQVRGAGSTKTLQGECNTFSLIFENLHFQGDTPSRNLFTCEDGSNASEATNPINFDTLAFRGCEINNFRWGIRSRATKSGIINVLEFTGNTVHDMGQSTSGEFMIWNHRIAEVNMSGNTFYNMSDGTKGLIWFNRLTADNEAINMTFFFENNLVACGMGTRTLIDLGQYLGQGSEYYINNNFFYYPDWESDKATPLEETPVLRQVEDPEGGVWADGTPKMVTWREEVGVDDDGNTVYRYDTIGTTYKMPAIIQGNYGTVYASGNIIKNYKPWSAGVSLVAADAATVGGQWNQIDLSSIDYTVSENANGTYSVKVNHAPSEIAFIEGNYDADEIGFSSGAWTLPQDGDFSLWKGDAAGSYTKGIEEAYVPGIIGPEQWYTDIVKQKINFTASLVGSQSAQLTVVPEKSTYFSGDEVLVTVDLKGLNEMVSWSDGEAATVLSRKIILEQDLDLVATVKEEDYLAVWLADYTAQVVGAPLAASFSKAQGPAFMTYVNADGENVRQVNKVTEVKDDPSDPDLVTRRDTTWKENFVELRSSKCEADPKPCYVVKTEKETFAEGNGYRLVYTLSTVGASGLRVDALVGTDGYTSKEIFIEYSIDGGQTWAQAGVGTIEQGQNWYPAQATLPAECEGLEALQVRFRGNPDADKLYPYDADAEEYQTYEEVVWEFWFLTNVKFYVDAITGIETLGSSEAPAALRAFDLQGRAVEAPAAGQLYIQGGKKAVRL